MKIAIFGDSWGDTRYPYVIHKDQDTWTAILSKKYEITNFCEAGSAVYFSAEAFLKNYYKDFDKIIFFASDRTRRYLPEYSSIKLTFGHTRETRHVKFNTSSNLKDVIEPAELNKEILLAVDLYYRYIANDEQDRYYHELTLDDIHSKLPSDKLLILENCATISMKEYQYYQSLGHDMTLFSEWKNCHMTHTNNRRMAELIDQWLIDPESTKLTIGNTRSINSELFYDPVDEPFEKYYKRIE